MKKKLTAILLAAAMAVTGLFTAMTPEKANAAEWEACDIPVIKDVSEFDAVSAMYSKTITQTEDSILSHPDLITTHSQWI